MKCPVCEAEMNPSWGKTMFTCSCGETLTYNEWRRLQANKAEEQLESGENENG